MDRHNSSNTENGSSAELENIGGHQSLDRDHLVYIDLATNRQQRAYSLVRELRRLTVSRLQRRNAPIMAALLASPPFSVGGWAWVYNSTSTIRQGVEKGTDATVLKTKPLLNWNGPFKILAVGPTAASDPPDNHPLQDKLLFLDLPTDLPGRDSKPRVSVKRCNSYRRRQLWKRRGAGRCEERDAGVSAPLGDSTGSSL